MKRQKHSRKKSNPRSSHPESRQPRPLRHPTDRVLLEHVDQILPGNVLLILNLGTALAPRLLEQLPDRRWHIFTQEHFFLHTAVDALSDVMDRLPEEANVDAFCLPDLPDDEFDTIILPTDFRGASEVTRDYLQAAAARLTPQGRLVVSTNNVKDHWLHSLLKEMFGRTTVHQAEDGICYVARSPVESRKVRDFNCEFAFRDGERLIRCASRPGVFSHRKIDGGARALIRSLDLLPDEMRHAPQRIVDMGCGCGAVGVAAALRYPEAQVLGVDSHARAVQATDRTAGLNEVTNVSTLLNSLGHIPDVEEWDLFLGNPPYYSDYRIAELFLQTAADVVRPGGRIHIVTKLTDWHENRMIEIFANADVHSYGAYDVIVSEVEF